MKKISKVSIFVLLFSLFFCSTVLAATQATTKPVVVPSNAILVADVNIYNAKIISQDGNKFKISFTFSNGQGSQTGIKYGINLLEKTKTSQYQVDEKIYDETISLNSNTKIKKEIEYIAPTSMSGDYKMILVAKNSSGLPFSIATVGEIKLTATSTGIKILNDCFLQVKDEKSAKVYSLNQGVDIKKEENLKLTCTAINSSKGDIIVTPSYVTRYRSSYGDIVDQKGGDTQNITFKSGESKTLSFILPKALTPQSYNIEFSLNNNDIKSNSIRIHYVIHGASATVQNLSTDKDYYKKGEVAKVSFLLSPSADSFPGSRLGSTLISTITSKIEILNGKNKKCADTVSKIIDNKASPKVDTEVPIKSSCFDPKIILSMIDENGTVLAQKEFSIKTTSQIPPKNNIWYIIIIILVLVLIIATIYLKRKNNKPKSSAPMSVLFFVLLLVSFGLIPTNSAKAATFTVGTFIGDSVDFTVGVNPTLEKDGADGLYTPGSNIAIDAMMSMSSCGNEPVDASLNVTITASDSSANLINETGYGKDTHPVWAGDTFVTGSALLPTPSVENTYLGSFNINFEGSTSSINGNSLGSVSMSESVRLPDPVSVSVWKDSTGSIEYNSQDSIYWNVINATSTTQCNHCNYTDKAGIITNCDNELGGKTSGNFYTPNLTSDTTFTISCE